MLCAGIVLGVLGALAGVAVSLAALVGAAVSAGFSAGRAALALLAGLVALASAVCMRAHWRKGALLDAACGAAGLLALPGYFIVPAVALLMPAALYVAGELALRHKVSASVRRIARQARAELECGAQGDSPDGAQGAPTGEVPDEPTAPSHSNGGQD